MTRPLSRLAQRRRRFGLILLFALPLTACGQTAELAFRAAVPLPPDLTKIHVELAAGELRISSQAEREFTVVDGRLRWSAADPAVLERLAAIPIEFRLTATDRPGEYRLEVPRLPDDLVGKEASVEVRCVARLPAEVALEIDNGGGNLAVHDRRAPVRLHTQRGEITVARSSGFADVLTGNGKVFVLDHRGGVKAVSGEPDRPKTSGGAVWARILELGPEGVDVSTHGDSIQLFLPRDASCEVDAQVMTGPAGKVSIREGFGLEVTPDGQGHVCRGRIRDGGPLVRARLGRGWLSIARGRLSPDER
ncbi:MAG: hypothetical protein AB7T19_14690 [Planctomycetota bacterium]